MRLSERIERDVERGVSLLDEIDLGSIEFIGRTKPKILITGAGDSYASAIASHHIYSGESVYGDPLTLSIDGHIARYVEEGYILLAISLGGRTRSVVRLAEKYRGLGGEVYAVTGSRESPLAKVSTHFVEVPYIETVYGSGIGRQIVLEAVLAKLLSGLEIGSTNINTEVERLAGEPCPRYVDGEVYVGINESIGTAYFTANKCREFFGCGARSVVFEELLHAEIFAVYGEIYVFRSLLADGDPYIRGRMNEAIETLGSLGYRVATIAGCRDPWISALCQKIHVLKCLSREVDARGIERPRFTSHGGLKELTRLIYIE